jgi:hypothetical protein
MRPVLVGLFLLLSLSQKISARTYREVSEVTAIFQQEKLEGTFVLLDIANDTTFVSNKTRAEKQDLSIRAEHRHDEGRGRGQTHLNRPRMLTSAWQALILGVETLGPG